MRDNLFVHAAHRLYRLRVKDALSDFFCRWLFVSQWIEFLQARPQVFFAVLRIVIETFAEALAPAVELLDELADHRIGWRGNVKFTEILLCLLHHVVAQLERNLVRDRKRADRHARVFRNVLDQRRVDAFGQHVDAFAAEYAENAASVKAPAVVDNDRRLPQLLNVIKRLSDRDIVGLLANDDLDQRHLFYRREEVDADELLRPFGSLGESRDRQRRRIRRKDRIVSNNGLGLRGDIGFDLPVFEYCLDDELATGKIVIFCRRMNPIQNIGSLVRRRAAFVDSFLQEVAGIVFAKFGFFLCRVQQHDLHAGSCRNKCNTGAHHPGAENAELFDQPLFRLTRPAHQLVSSPLVDEQSTGHVARYRAHQHQGEILGFNVERLVHR